VIVDATVHDRSGLLLSGSPPPTDAEINRAELVGIGATRDWLKRTRMDVTRFAFWPRLHREMFGEVWAGAGKWRQEEENIGVAPHQIQPELYKLEGDLRFWLGDDCDMSRLEVLSRFHHRAVWIHPFNNGNGRWSRLATDAIAVRSYKLNFLTWANAGDGLRDPKAPERKAYIAAIKAGDEGDMSQLIAYIGERNAGI
jgi:Fic-DOC domain mobile mystery protein B